MRRFTARTLLITYLLALSFSWSAWVQTATAQTEETPVNFKIAFIGDQGLGSDARAVLSLIKSEGADAVMHQGDFDYDHDPAAWDAQINDILGSDFPYFASPGNHDDGDWDGTDGYQRYLEDRMNRLGVTWQGDLGVQSSNHYEGIFMVFVAPDVLGSGHDTFIRDQLAADHSIWSICSWHKNMKNMQVGGKSDETGWGVYEESRKGGAIIATGHEHSYSRTYLLSDMENQVVASRSDTLVLTKGETFAFVSGLAGRSIRDQELSGDWWASIYTSDQDANYGALFGEFNYQGVPNLARFYFKDIDGVVPDSFYVVSDVESVPTLAERRSDTPLRTFVLEQNYPNPFNPSTTIRFHTSEPHHARLVIVNMVGQEVRVLLDRQVAPGDHEVLWDGRDEQGVGVPSGVYVYRLESEGQVVTRRALMIK
jgi:hypothetical protein